MNVQADRSATAGVPRGVVTFLFTDIEGSTRRWETDPDEMRVALEAHDRTLRDAISDCGGTVFKHTGDGMCAVFTSPRAAVDAAIESQRAVQLPVRMGIATGEAQQRDGDYFGPALNRAARIMAAGHGGQVLADGITAELLDNVDLIDMGPRRLRDIPNPVHVHQVASAGLRAEFPPLRTSDPAPGNLRRPTTGFVGREAELEQVRKELDEHRLVTLTGVGGVGKTRLALEVAASVTDRFGDGVWLVELAPVGDPDAVPGAVAAVLGITHQPNVSLVESVAAAHEGRSRLLVLDNCEHVLDAVAELAEAILSHSADTRILATSREGLRTADERIWPLASLDVATSASALFTQRACDLDPGISLDSPHDRDAVLEICRRLDGIPLAIELAASRLQSMTVGEVRDRIGDRFRLLIGSRRGLARHQTLRHAVQWSFDLLDDDERALLARCSVFAGGFDLAAAARVSGPVCGNSDEFATLHLLDSLVRKSLLVADRSAGRTRFTMLETIRQFAEDRLLDAADAAPARSAHAKYFAGLERALFDLWDGPRQREAYEWLGVELSNLRAAFRWAADNLDLDAAAAIAVYAGLIGSCVELREPVGWAEELVPIARRDEHRRLAQLCVIASHCYAAGRIEDAVAYGATAESALESDRYDPVPYDFETNIGGGASAIRGEAERWITVCRNVIERSPGPHTYARSSLTLGLTLAGADAEAVAESQGLLAAADATDNPHVKSYALVAYGIANRDVDPAGARAVERRALAIAQDSGNRQVEHVCAVSLARLSVLLGDDPREALRYLELAIRIRHDSGTSSLVNAPLSILGIFLARAGRFPPAVVILGYASTMLIPTHFPETVSVSAELREALGDDDYEALTQVGKTMTTAEVVAYAYEQIALTRAELP